MMQTTTTMINTVIAVLMSRAASFGMKVPISPPLPPVMKLRSEGRIGSPRRVILMRFATENTIAIAEKTAVAIQNRLKRKTSTR